MKTKLLKLALLLSLFFAFSGAAHAQCSSFSFSQVFGQLQTCIVGATAVNSGQIVTLNTSGFVVPISAGATAGAFGVAIQNGSTGSLVLVLISGQAQVSVDNACTIGQYVIVSTTIAGDGHCVSSAGSNQWVGTSASLLAAAGAANVQVSPSSTGEAGSGGSMVYPSAGIGVSTGSAWGTSLATQSIAPNQVRNYASPNCGAQTNCYPVYANTKFVWDANWTNGTQTVTCPNTPCNFTSADVGKVVFGTNASSSGGANQETSTVLLPEGTITAVNSATSITVSVSGSSITTCTPSLPNQGCLLVWGTLDSATAAQTQSTTNDPLYKAWNATDNACAALELPAAVMLVEQPEFDGGTTSCQYGDESLRQTDSLIGTFGQTIIIITPSFKNSACVYPQTGSLQTGCFLSVNHAINAQGINFWGAGNSAGGLSGNYAAIIDQGGSAGSYNSVLDHITFMGWGAGTTGFGGLYLGQGVIGGNYLQDDGTGAIGCTAGAAFAAYPGAGFMCVDNLTYGLYVKGGTFSTIGASYGFQTGTGGCAVFISAGTFNSYGDTIWNQATSGCGVTNASSNSNQSGFNMVGGLIYVTTASSTTGFINQNSATAYISGGAQIQSASGSGSNPMSINSGTVYLDGVYAVSAITSGGGCYVPGGTVYMHNVNCVATATGGIGLYISSGAKVFDQGGNKFTGTSSNITVLGTLFGSASITGTAQTASNITASTGWGTSGAAGNGISSVSGDSSSETFTVTAAGTPSASPTIAIVFPTTFYVAPQCQVQQIGGTGALQLVSQSTLPSTTGVTLKWNGTPVASSTYIFNLTCSNP